MQNAKDSFYLALRDRLTVLNPARQVTIGGAARPGILVEENEAPSDEPWLDVFVLRWAGTAVDTQKPTVLESQQCEIVYGTAGSVANAWMDRGRAMTEMDAEIAAILMPAATPKVSVGSTVTVPMQTNIFWGAPEFGAVKRSGPRLERHVAVTVYSLQETLSTGGLER